MLRYYKPVCSGEDLISVQSDVMLLSNWVASKHLKFNTHKKDKDLGHLEEEKSSNH